ncbi:hypothetical protein COC49_00805 [Bacillus cereus]|nr:hypothetical protein A9987_25480 [Bacillus cereus]PGR70427.1 hypothetical protein COC49_00805 [Bacillus cereus]
MSNIIFNNQEKIVQLVQQFYAKTEFQRLVDEVSKKQKINISRYNIKEYTEINVNNQITQLLILTYLNSNLEILLLNEFNKEHVIILKDIS